MLSLLLLAIRSWKSAKGLAVLCVLALAVGIGCATAIFTVVDAVLLKPLPYQQAERWVALFSGSTTREEQGRMGGLSPADLTQYQQQTQSFDAFGWFRIGGDYNLTSPGEPEHIEGVEVTPSLINNVGVTPLQGRLFQEADGENVALVSARLARRLGANGSILGKPIVLDGGLFTVVGVMPAWFRLPILSVTARDVRNDVWLPVQRPHNDAEERGFWSYAAYGRMRRGVDIGQARADAKRVAAGIAKQDPGGHPSYTAVVFSLRDLVAKEIRPRLLLLFGAAGLLLLITCSNVAGLLLTRAVGRARETAIRVALGAGRKQLALQFFLEGLLVATVAAAFGIAASLALVRLVIALAAEYIPFSDEISVDWMAVIFAASVACVTAVVSALAPLWQAMRTQPSEVLSDGVRASAGARSRQLSRALVVAEIALAFTLLSISALLIAQLRNLNRTAPGFTPDHLLTFQLSVPNNRYRNSQALAAYHQQLLQTLRTIPGCAAQR